MLKPSLNKEVFSTDGLHYSYGAGRFEIQTPAFKIFANETIALIGPSGEGKTTFLRLLEGSLGDLKIPNSALIYQDLRLVGEETALTNILMGSLKFQKGLSFSKDQINEAKELSQALGIEPFENLPVSSLSGGQKQRVATARALMSRPKLLLADEPLSHLDKKTALETFKLLKEMQKKLNFALLVSIHHLDFLELEFSRVWTMREGQLQPDEAPLLTQPQKITAQKKTNHSYVEKIILITLISIVFASLLSIDKSGLRSENSLSSLFTFIKQIFWQNSHTLSGVKWGDLFVSLLQTIQMAAVGTFFGFLISLPLSLLAVETISTQGFSRFVRWIAIFIRSIPTLLWALIFVAGLGLGSIAGIAALTVYTTGYLTKLLYEGFENLEQKSFTAIRQLGASRWQAIYYSLIPNARPLLIAQFIFMFEYNIRSASILGIVGAGGIGQDLIYSIEWRDFPTVFSILFLFITIVFIFDTISQKIRSYYGLLRGV